MNHKTIATAVTLTAGIGLAVQDFGVPPGIPYEFVEGEVAVVDEVNANFEWIEQQLDALDAADSSRSQSFLASGNVSYGDCFGGGGPWLGETMQGGGCSNYIGWLDIPVPTDWDKSTDMTVTFSLSNYVNFLSGQVGETIDLEVYGTLIGLGDSVIGSDICDPGPDYDYDFFDSFQLTVPTVQTKGGPPLPFSGVGGSIPSGLPHPVTATFTISPDNKIPVAGGFGPWDNPLMIRVSLFTQYGPILGAPGKTTPCLFLDSNAVTSGLEEQFFNPTNFVQLDYLAG